MNQAKIEQKGNKKQPLTLRKNFSWTFLGNVIYAACQWFLLVILAKLESPEIVGRFSLALAVTAPIIMLTNLQLRSVQATDTKQTFRFSDYLGLRIITSFIAFMLTILVVRIAGYKMETTLVIVLMCLARIVESISDVVFGLMQKNEVMNRIATSMIYKGLLSLLAMGITVWLTNSLFLGTLALALAWFLVLIIYDVKNVKDYTEFKPNFNFKLMSKLINLSLPLGIVLMIGSISTNIPRYFLEFYINEETLGYFAAMAYLVIVGNTIMNALGQSASPRLAQYFAVSNLNSFKLLINKLMGIGFLVGVVGLLLSLFVGEEILTLIYEKEYANYSNIFVLIMISGLINYTGSILGYGITATRSFKIQPIIGVFWMVTSFVSSLLLIPGFGLKGAAYTLIVTSIIQTISKLVVLKYLLASNKNALK